MNYGREKKVVGKTGLSKKTNTPEWGEAFKIEAPEHTHSIRVVLKTIIAKLTYKKEEIVGEIKIPMNTIFDKGTIEKQFGLAITRGESCIKKFHLF